MPIRQEEILNILKVICEKEEIYVSAKESIKGGVIAGASTMFGGLLFGPAGLAIGGTIGGFLAYKNSNQFQPVFEVIMNLPQKQKDYLHQEVWSIIRHLDSTDVVLLMALINRDQMTYLRILSLIQNFIKSELGMTMKS